MAYLQLADNSYDHLAAAPMQFYIFIPQGFRGATKDSYIREDLFDKMDPQDYAQIMQELAPYQETGLSDKASRKAARAQKKLTKGPGARRDAKALRVKTRQDAKTARVAAGGGFSGILGKVGDVAKNIFGKSGDASLDVQSGGGGLEIDYNAGGEESFFERNKIPLIIGGVVIAAGAIYLVTKKKK